MDINTTRVNRLCDDGLIGLTMQDEHRRCYPGGHSCFWRRRRFVEVQRCSYSHAFSSPERHGEEHRGGIRRAMGRPDYLYLFITLRRVHWGSQALAGVHVRPAAVGNRSGVALAAESDEALMRRFTPEQWRNLQRRMWRNSASRDTCCGITLMVKFLWRNR